MRVGMTAHSRDSAGKRLPSNKKRPGRIGALGELLVAADLLRRGHDVYRSLAADSPTDLICLRRGSTRVLRVQVRSKSSAGTYRIQGATMRDADLVALVDLRPRVPKIMYQSTARGLASLDTAEPGTASLTGGATA
jgi:hypothetical protein